MFKNSPKKSVEENLKTQKSWIKAVVTLSLLLILNTPARADVPSTHGMLLFGNKVTYASHLPMFHAPHDYQVVLKLKLTSAPRSQTLNYYESSKNAGETLFTLVPEVMDLVPVMKGERTQFSANIFKGHFEKAGAVNLGRVSVEVQEVVYAQKIAIKPLPAIETNEKYLYFGSIEQREYFAIHLIQHHGSLFDHVIQAGFAGLQTTWCGKRTCNPFSGNPLIMELGTPDLMDRPFLFDRFTVTKAPILNTLFYDNI